MSETYSFEDQVALLIDEGWTLNFAGCMAPAPTALNPNAEIAGVECYARKGIGIEKTYHITRGATPRAALNVLIEKIIELRAKEEEAKKKTASGIILP